MVRTMASTAMVREPRFVSICGSNGALCEHGRGRGAHSKALARTLTRGAPRPSSLYCRGRRGFRHASSRTIAHRRTRRPVRPARALRRALQAGGRSRRPQGWRSRATLPQSSRACQRSVSTGPPAGAGLSRRKAGQPRRRPVPIPRPAPQCHEKAAHRLPPSASAEARPRGPRRRTSRRVFARIESKSGPTMGKASKE